MIAMHLLRTQDVIGYIADLFDDPLLVAFADRVSQPVALAERVAVAVCDFAASVLARGFAIACQNVRDRCADQEDREQDKH